MILRFYAKYLHQIGTRFGQAYIEKTLGNYPEIAHELVNLFIAKFDPKQKNHDAQIKKIILNLEQCIGEVKNLDEDRILRQFAAMIKATLRTNYFQTENGQPKEYVSCKLASHSIPELPEPKPLYEIFVYSPRFEAIHLRSAKVARGGIRWSDRLEDFRTEVLGLMKAQKVKNAIIVPSGAKGGFILKKQTPQMTREALQVEVINCYKSFMRGLLDITDNLKNQKVIRPKQVVCYDDADTYLVVAADKGTATFSDIANDVAKEYDFWLGDAFASGGATGYDHKKMGITARGAWESIKRHFCNIGINIKETDFTVIGIGDMSGDVFGNGMMYSDHIKLIAAFDHRHIFIDPNPNPAASFKERVRLFHLARSSWDDYDKKLISAGGGVFSRASKSITLSPEIKKALDIKDNALTPNELIRAVLQAPVDLLFNGGIGTYVKASIESQSEVGDKTNEYCRINGGQLRCRVVGEGGNLGFTQLGRVEYALNGGLINTDFIDNSAGVDCSDHEVNIKILLDKEVRHGKLTEKKRNQLLASMTDEVAALVLQDNFNQALAMSVSNEHSNKLIGLYHSYLKELEATKVIDRLVEFLPDDKKILERKASQIGFTSPELALLLAYTKIHVKNEILKTNIASDPYLSAIITTAFPAVLSRNYSQALQEHPLRAEIIATQLSNHIVNEMGITFVYRLQTETGYPIDEIVRAHAAASEIFESKKLYDLIDSLEFKIPPALQYELLHHVRNLINLATRWFLRGNRLQWGLEKTIAHYKERVKQLEKIIPDLMSGVTKSYVKSVKERFSNIEIPAATMNRITITRAIYTSLNIIEVSTQHKLDLINTAKIYFKVGGRFHLVWFRDQIAADNREGHWNTLARLTLRDELDMLQKILTIVIMQQDKKEPNCDNLMDKWIATNNNAITRWEKILELLHAATATDYSMFFITIRELSNWVLATKSL